MYVHDVTLAALHDFENLSVFHSAITVTAVCPTCGHKEAYFRQMQLRSADEPMTSFYKCANFATCGHNWRGD